MDIQYVCRHCGDKLGEIGFEYYERVQASLSDLDEEERLEFIHYHENGAKVITICENCQRALEENPRYFEYDDFLQ